jgi:hypothetical protein
VVVDTPSIRFYMYICQLRHINDRCSYSIYCAYYKVAPDDTPVLDIVRLMNTEVAAQIMARI